jgi:hypothetical protein
MSTKKWGKFTVRGTEKVEELITSMVLKVANTVEKKLEGNEYEALILIGGYGRGEGGVVVVDGEERPHNNFDFVLIVKNLDGSAIDDLKKKMMQALEPVIKEIQFGVDLSVINAGKLRHASCRVIWYDMRFGHKTILGNASFIPSIQHFTIANIPDWDARNLLVNRGTLMIINDLLLEKSELSQDYKKLIVKHVVKAIIGYGDTLLYFLDDYNWSYVEKQKRMQKRSDVVPAFKAIYDEAMNFRFQPDYDNFLKKDLLKWMEELRIHFEKIFLICESKRLKKTNLNWENYAETAFKFALFDEITSLKPLAKKILAILKNRKYPGKGCPGAKLGFKTLRDDGVLPILFPLFAYHLQNADYRKLAANFLYAKSTEFNDLRKAYLRYWGRVGDTNFINVLKKYEISLED